MKHKKYVLKKYCMLYSVLVNIDQQKNVMKNVSENIIFSN